MDFANNKSMQKSILENMYFFTNKIILCLLKRQQTVVQSITKVQYYILAKAVFKILQLNQIMGQIMYLNINIMLVRLYGNN